MTRHALRASLEPLRDRPGLAREWRTLEAVCRSSFFCSWDWIGPFVASLPAAVAPRVLRVHDEGDQLLGLGLWWPHVERRHGFVRSRVLHLNETGLAAYDRTTIEHNGLLAPPGREAEVIGAALSHLRSVGAWDELALGGLRNEDHEAWRNASAVHGLGCRVRWEKPYYFVDLERIRAAGTDYLESLSSNTRYQARRALRLYAKRGPLVCEIAETPEVAQQWLQQLVHMHQAQWTARGHDGAFGSDFTQRFHARLVSDASPGSVWMTRLRAGDSVIGYLYNFHRDGIVYNYQSGHVAEQDSKLKPGLVCHALAIEQALCRGCHAYDLMMGGGHFKASLTNAEGAMTWSTLQRPRFAFRLEAWLRAARQAVAKRRAGAEASVPADATDEGQAR